MREIRESDYTIQVDSPAAPTLADLIEGANYVIDTGYTSSENELLLEQFVELVDYLTGRLITADSARFS